MTVTAEQHRQRIVARSKLVELADLIDSGADDFNVVDALAQAVVDAGLRPKNWRP